MKKLTVLLLVALLLAACGANPEPTVQTTVPTTLPATQPTVQTQTQPTTPPPTEPATVPSTVPVKAEKYDETACAPLFGTWKTTITMDKELLNTSYFTKKVQFDLFYSFNQDGSFSVHVDEEAFTTAIEEFEGLMVEHMVERGYATFKADMERSGYSADRIDTMWAEGEEEKVRTETQDFIKELKLLNQFSKLLRGGTYYVEEGRVYTELAESGWESSAFKVKKGKLTLSDTDNPGIYRMLHVNFPLVLEQQ